MPSSSESRYIELLNRAQGALDRDDLDEAEVQARRALMLQPDSIDARAMVGSLLLERGQYDEAAEMFEEVLERDPENLPCLADLGLCLFQLAEFEEAEAVLDRAARIDPEDPQTSYWLALCVERRGEYDLAESYFRRAHAADPDRYPLPYRLGIDAFQRVVEHAVEQLKEGIRHALDDLTIIVEDLPSDALIFEYDPPLAPDLFGLYAGVPLPERQTSDVPKLPDVIYLFKRNLERYCADEATLLHEIRTTVIHEVGHYLGLDEDELEERGLA